MRILIVLALLCPTIYAADIPPSDASLQQLLEVAQVHKILDTTMTEMDAMMKNVFQQITGSAPHGGKQLSAHYFLLEDLRLTVWLRA